MYRLRQEKTSDQLKAKTVIYYFNTRFGEIEKVPKIIQQKYIYLFR